MNFIYVFIGGGLGAIARYGIAKITTPPENGFPLATFVTNIISCILLGCLFGYFMGRQDTTKLQLLLMTGFCGGFSTFSTFSLEAYKLLQNGQSALALIYIGLSVIISLCAIFCGLKLVSLF